MNLIKINEDDNFKDEVIVFFYLDVIKEKLLDILYIRRRCQNEEFFTK